MKSCKASTRLALAITAAIAIASGCRVAAANYEIAWYTIDGGGGVSASFTYEVSGTVGQPDAGSSTGGGYELTGAFWAGTIGAVPSCPGDLYADGVVDVIDLLILLSRWGPCPEPCPPYCLGDINLDCVVNTADLLILLGNWGACP